MKNQNEAKKALLASWNEQIANGNITKDEMADSLDEQISGYLDLSLDEFDEEMAAIVQVEGQLTDSQIDEWQKLVNQAAIEWLVRFELDRLGVEENEEGIEAIAEALAEATSFEQIQKGIADHIDR